MKIDLTTESSREKLFDRLLQSPELERLGAVLGGRAQPRAIVVSGVSGSARALVVAALQKKVQRKMVFIARSNRECDEFQQDLEFFYSALNGSSVAEGAIMSFPAHEGDPYDGTSPHAEVLEERALALFRLCADSSEPRILLTSLPALAQRTVEPSLLKSCGITLKPGDDMPLELIVDLLIAGGYIREEPVGAVGEFSVRGGILDVFSPSHQGPHRIEFFGDTVESIREFDPDTQRSVGRVQETALPPMREVAVRREELISWAEAARLHWAGEQYRRDLRFRAGHAERGEPFPGWEYLMPLTRSLNSSALDYLKDAILIVDEPSIVEKSLGDFYHRLEIRFAQADDAGELALAPDRLFLSVEDVRDQLLSLNRVELRLLGREASVTDQQFQIDSLTLEGPHARQAPAFPVGEETDEVSLIAQAPRRYHGRIPELASAVGSDSSTAFVFVMPSLGLAERVSDVLGEYGVTARLAPDFARGDTAGFDVKRAVTVGKLSNGFVMPAFGLSILIDSDVFGEVERAAQPRPARKQRGAAAFLSDLGDLKIGDFVVHVDHGIGQFQGLKQIPIAGSSPTGSFNLAEGIDRGSTTREFVLLTYAEGAKLYVPVERLDLVQRYSAGEGHKPQVDRLGGAAWQKTKARARRAMRDLAEELLKLYAERKLAQGYASGPDTAWQGEFEDAFEYELTPDQESAIEEVKSDMEKLPPMDRLIVGDVGYGKTEVAMRAAFKAVMEGKQVAVLAPTTVLVYQHYKTFQQRFSAFPARVEMLSRFRGPKDQKEVVSALESGSVDVVVGTHRLLSKDVRFRDLGLLVVDEEQRFGVSHKEKIKQLRKKVDVISMSATPIPRTLNMSLAGLRDMSVIETPPRDRLAIQTHVVQFTEPVIRGAVELELQRGGQVFFVHNRVETIYSMAELLSRLAPSARIGVGHGQMSEKELEEVMLKFIRHELDALVSTTIIENGIDIPLANTIIINRADMYGLSQLYQLRGRVGRSNRRAYAYLLIPSEEILTDLARRRLAAIREFSDLGAGFRIAALDLELRGAGNLLGAEQSGHIDSIGFDLYTRMLERTVREMKGEPANEEPSTVMNLGIDIRIPQDYISDMSQRLRAYKRISSAQNERELADVHAEMQDRYGPIPETVEDLFEYARVRREAARLGVVSIDKEGNAITFKLAENAGIDPEKLVRLVAGGGAGLSPSGVLKVELQPTQGVLADVMRLLKNIA